MMNGGEHVFTAAETAAIMANANKIADANPVSADSERASSNGGTYQVTFSPVYHIGDNADAASIRAILTAHDEELMDMMESRLQDLEVDKARRSYA